MRKAVKYILWFLGIVLVYYLLMFLILIRRDQGFDKPIPDELFAIRGSNLVSFGSFVQPPAHRENLLYRLHYGDSFSLLFDIVNLYPKILQDEKIRNSSFRVYTVEDIYVYGGFSGTVVERRQEFEKNYKQKETLEELFKLRKFDVLFPRLEKEINWENFMREIRTYPFWVDWEHLDALDPSSYVRTSQAPTSALTQIPRNYLSMARLLNAMTLYTCINKHYHACDRYSEVLFTLNAKLSQDSALTQFLVSVIGRKFALETMTYLVQKDYAPRHIQAHWLKLLEAHPIDVQQSLEETYKREYRVMELAADAMKKELGIAPGFFDHQLALNRLKMYYLLFMGKKDFLQKHFGSITCRMFCTLNENSWPYSEFEPFIRVKKDHFLGQWGTKLARYSVYPLAFVFFEESYRDNFVWLWNKDMLVNYFLVSVLPRLEGVPRETEKLLQQQKYLEKLLRRNLNVRK